MSDQMQLALGFEELRIEEISLLEHGLEIIGPGGLIYSTKPRWGTSEGSVEYALKGPDTYIVFSELAAHLLAKMVGVLVPPFAITKEIFQSEDGSGCLFASRKMSQRDVEFMIMKDSFVNGNNISATIALDIWIANPDRNMGNFVAESAMIPDQMLFTLYAIDFEKSRALRPDMVTRIISSPNEKYWPTGVLADIIQGVQPPNYEFISKVQSITDTKIDNLFDHICNKLAVERDDFRICESILIQRARNLPNLIEEGWQ